MTHGGWQGSGEAGPGPALQPAADACPALPPSPAQPTRSPRLRERPARPWDPGAGGQRPHHPRAAALSAPPWARGQPLPPPRLRGPSRALRKVARAQEAGGEEGRREAEAWTRRAAAEPAGEVS